MKTNGKWTLLAMAVSALAASTAAQAGERDHQQGDRSRHNVEVNLEKDLRLSSDIEFSGDPSISGDIDLDSAAIAIIDNRQSITANGALNDKLSNEASIADDVGSNAAGNLGFNAAAGDNNAQDNAAALSAADASFSFGMADAEVFVNQYGANNQTMNLGVTNAASLGGNAFSGASGNIGVNVASGNNNGQKNALAASVATTAYAQSSISSNQVSTGNMVNNAGIVQEYTETTDVSLSGPVSGWTAALGYGVYEGSSSGSYSGTGNAYQKTNFYPDNWTGDSHPAGNATGHSDWDNETQGAVMNPYAEGVGGIAFDTDEEGSYSGSESGQLGFLELGVADLYAELSGSVATTRYIVVDATNTASLSGSAFANASGNIGVNVAAGTGNLQANSLALAVAQPSTGGGGGSE
ncbi:adhesin [Xanthomonas sp. AmX2]|nr:adhesin [Xanthomonas sp.]MBN6149631.1 adhesin [Xanthomonas sp.]